MAARDQRGDSRALRFKDSANRVALAWYSGDGWQVRAEDDVLGARVQDALRRPTVIARSRTEPDGERVLEGWEAVSPADRRYPGLFLLQFSRLGLDDLAGELVPRSEMADAVPTRSHA
jgi:hypothetical protein